MKEYLVVSHMVVGYIRQKTLGTTAFIVSGVCFTLTRRTLNLKWLFEYFEHLHTELLDLNATFSWSVPQGTFMECRPYGSISHRFHRDCASILKDCRFCPHCGEDASGAKEVTVPKTDQSPSVPRSNPRLSLPTVPTVATLPSGPTTPAVPQILRAKKTSEPQRNRDESPSR